MQVAQTKEFDFIITDIIMPGLEGWDVLDSVHGLKNPPRVIIITAHDKEKTRDKAREKGAWACVEKPFLIKEIKTLLSQPFEGPTGANFR